MPASAPMKCQPFIERVRKNVQALVSNEKTLLGGSLKKVESKTGVKREFIFYGCVVLIMVYLAFGWANNLICDLIGFVYPCLQSIRAIESKPAVDDCEWLMYWVVFSGFMVVEHLIGFAIAFIPFYQLLKCFLLLWMMVPGSHGGSHVIYYMVVKPLFMRHREQIDKHMSRVEGVLKQTSDGAKMAFDKFESISGVPKAD